MPACRGSGLGAAPPKVRSAPTRRRPVAAWEQAHRLGGSITAVLSVPEWRAAGRARGKPSLNLVKCTVPRLGLADTLLIGAIAFHEDGEGGRRTELTVAPPAAFTPKPQGAGPKRPARLPGRAAPWHTTMSAVMPADMDHPNIAADFLRRARNGSGAFAIAYAVLVLAEAQDRTASGLRALGTGDAAAAMGALEFHATHVGEKLARARGRSRSPGRAPR